jgi:type II secretory pathway pseudopilin PulG
MKIAARRQWQGVLQVRHFVNKSRLAGKSARTRNFRTPSRFTRARDDTNEAGYSIVESLVGISLLAVVLLAADRGAIGSLSAATVAKEHSVATGLVTSATAQAVALPFADLQSGLNPSVDSLLTDPNIVKSGSNYLLELNGSVVPTADSTIAVSNTKNPESPLVPHVTTVNEGIRYTVSTYPTTAPSAPGLVTVVVVVSWKAPTGGIEKVVSEDGIAAP